VHRLYAASNIASVFGLLIYVAVLEPFVGVSRQSTVLWAGYGGAMLLVWFVARRASTAIGLAAPRIEHSAFSISTEHRASSTKHAERESRFGWVALSFSASACLYAVNTYIATDVASFPLLWCVPLAIFLTAF